MLFSFGINKVFLHLNKTELNLNEFHPTPPTVIYVELYKHLKLFFLQTEVFLKQVNDNNQFKIFKKKYQKVWAVTLCHSVSLFLLCCSSYCPWSCSLGFTPLVYWFNWFPVFSVQFFLPVSVLTPPTLTCTNCFSLWNQLNKMQFSIKCSH